MALNMKTLTQALAKTAAVIEKTVQTTVQEVTGPRALQDYELLDQIGSGGPAHAWKLYSARPRGSTTSQYPVVCVWLLDKRTLSEVRSRAGLSKAAEDAFFDIIRADASRLVRLRHPGVVHVVQALDENKNAMAMVTEPLFASVANTLGAVDSIAKVPKELKGMEMGILEVKHGLLQVAETLDFLHNNAQLIHRAISPETVYITSNGAWKLGGFGFAISVDQASSDLSNVQPFHYAEYDVEDSLLPLQPSLNYIAPELVRSKASSAGCSSDIFSFGCLAFHLIARKPLLDCHNNVKMYMNHLTYLTHESFSSIPPELVFDLQRMLSVDMASRPTAMDFTGSPFFRDDTRLRALRFLDHMLERDNMQKSEFLKALSDMWKDFDSRVLRYKVLPPLCAELRNLVMQPMILPMVLTIAESQDKNDFELSTMPALVPVLGSASGETLLLLVKHAELIINKTTQEHLIAHVLPLLVRAYDDTDARMQEEVLRRTVSLVKQLDSQVVKQVILPRVHGLALKTTIAAVRVNALLCLSDLVPSLDKHSVLDILQTLQRCTAVDHSAPTLMCTLGVANSILKQYGVEFTAEHCLPLLAPLLIAQQLNVQQFAKYMLFVKDILRKIEEKRGVTVTDSGASEVRITSSLANGLHSEQRARGVVPSSIKSGASWDEDWGPQKNAEPASGICPSEPNSFSIERIAPISQPIPATLVQSESASKSVPAVDIEWPPPASTTAFVPQFGGGDKLVDGSKGSSDMSFDDIDPFADWPPRQSNSAGNLVSTQNSSIGLSSHNIMNSGMSNSGQDNLAFAMNNKPIGLSMQSYGNPGLSMSSNQTSLGFSGTNKPSGLSKQYQGTSTSNIINPNGVGSYNSNSIGFAKQNQSMASSNIRNATTSFNTDGRAADIGSIFASSTSEHPMPKLAPPPQTAAGRGRGRGQGTSRSNNAKTQSGQPPILDLL